MVSQDKYRINNDVLHKLFTNPMKISQTETMRKIFPNDTKEGEIIVSEKDLKEAGYVGRLPILLFRIGKWEFSPPHMYKDYWLRLKLTRKKAEALYSIFKDVD